MYSSVIFVDFENIQTVDKKLIDSNTKIVIMVGLGQDEQAFEYTKDLFNDVSSIELIKVNGQGKNALDIFIAFYLGKYFEIIKDAKIYIFSNDSDYDKLINHLKNHKITIMKKGSAKKPQKQNVQAKKQDKVNQKSVREANDDIWKIIDYLTNQTQSEKNGRPKKVTTLENHLYVHFARKISKEIIKKAIKKLENDKKIFVSNNKVEYGGI